MTSSPPRRMMRLLLTLRGVVPAITRVIDVDGDLALADLHTAIQLLYDGEQGAHHVFSDTDPFPGGLPETAHDERTEHEGLAEHDECVWYRHPYHLGGLRQRRWGDRWTMIDWRDPEVVSESSTRLRAVLGSRSTLHYSFTLGETWWLRIDVVGDDVVGADSPPIRIVGAENRAPLDVEGGAARYSACLRALDDPSHPEHADTRRAFDRVVGPWARFDPAEVDLEQLQRDLQERWPWARVAARPRPRMGTPGTPLESLVSMLPPSNRGGLRRHIAATGVLLPPLATRAEAAQFVQPFAWLVARTGLEGTPLADDDLPFEVQREWADAAEHDIERIPRLTRTARRLGIVRRLRGRLVATKAAVAAADDPLALWRHLATALLSRRGAEESYDANVLLCLSIADGSLSDLGSALDRIRLACSIIGQPAVRRAREHGCEYGYGYWYGETRRPAVPWASAELEPSRVDDARGAELTLRAIEPFAVHLESLGLRRDGREWLAPPVLREFARAALNGR